jgi:hypothetical protein
MATTVLDLKNGRVNSVKSYNFSIATLRKSKRYAKVDQSLPFRIRLTNITISGYGPSSPAPIGIAIIGFNNYIL